MFSFRISLAILALISVATFASAQNMSKPMPRANMALTKQVQAENHQIAAAANIEWFARNCSNSVDNALALRAQRFLQNHSNQGQVRLVRGYIQKGASMSANPCQEGARDLAKSVNGFNRTF